LGSLFKTAARRQNSGAPSKQRRAVKTAARHQNSGALFKTDIFS
jgi:hypothetical protein